MKTPKMSKYETGKNHEMDLLKAILRELVKYTLNLRFPSTNLTIIHNRYLGKLFGIPKITKTRSN